MAGASAPAEERSRRRAARVSLTFKKTVHMNKKGEPGKKVQRRAKSAEKRAARAGLIGAVTMAARRRPCEYSRKPRPRATHRPCNGGREWSSGASDGLCSRATGSEFQFQQFRQGEGAAPAHPLHAGAAGRRAARHLHPDARHRSERACPAAHPAAGRRSRHVQHAVRRRRAAHGDLRARHHALHLGLDHHAADEDGVSGAGSAEEGRRGRPQDAQPVHALRHRRPGGVAGLRHRHRTRALGRRRYRSGVVLPHFGGDYADRRHDPADVAGRADHQPRRRQRHFAHHLRGHRCALSHFDHAALRVGPHRRHRSAG